MTSSEKIICRVAFWYYRRMALMLLLTVGGGGWFFYDGKFAWPAKNVVFFAKEAFDSGGRGESWPEFKDSLSKISQDTTTGEDSMMLLQKAHSDGGEDQTWLEFSKSTKGKSVLKKINEDTAKDAYINGQKRNVTWQDYAELKQYAKDKKSAMQGGMDGLNQFEGCYNSFAAATAKRDWAVYGVVSSGQQGWEVKNPKFHSASEIKGQIIIAFCLLVSAFCILINALINSRRVLIADADNLISEKGEIISCQSIYRIDTRKWAKKGLAYVFYDEGDASKNRAVIDDLKFVGADLILDRMKDRISGEIIEVVDAEEKV
ncbi:MAG: hypothetical protein GWP42_02200 [Verrucomicrobiales bacterium]|nr:hypothetical protein [Verrucomicrobiales bacterium]